MGYTLPTSLLLHGHAAASSWVPQRMPSGLRTQEVGRGVYTQVVRDGGTTRVPSKYGMGGYLLGT